VRDITILDSYPHVNGVVNLLHWTWIEEQSARDEHGILRIIFEPCAGIRLTNPPSTEPFLIQEIAKQCRRTPRERAELLALGGDWAVGEETTPEETTPIVRERWCRRTREKLAGKHQNEYRNRSEFDAGVILSLVREGASRDECFAALENNQCSGRWKTKGNISWFNSTYNSAVRKAETDSPRTVEVRKRIEQLYPVVSVMEWRGGAAINARKTLKAAMLIAYKVGSLTFHASSFEVSEVAVIPRQTADDGLYRLCASGITTLLGDGHQHRYGSVYRLNLSKLEKEAQSSHLLFGSLRSKSKWPNNALSLNELFSSVTLPSSSQELYESLGYRGPMTSKQLCGSGRRIETVRRALRVMRRYGVVQKQGKLWSVDESSDLEQLSTYLDAAEFCQNESRTATVDSARQNLIEKHRALREKRFDKTTGQLKTEILDIALEAGDLETQRLLLCPAVQGVH
jgi:hypothetical protein